MKEKDINKKEKWLAFRCLRCRNQVAERVIIDTGNDNVLMCPICGGDLKQMTHDEIFGEAWGNRIPNPYYVDD